MSDLVSEWEHLLQGASQDINPSWDEALTWFNSIDIYPKLFWKGREHSDIYLCVGIGRTTPNLPVFHVVSFDPNQPQWQGFPCTLQYTPYGVMRWNTTGSTLSKATVQQDWQPPKGTVQKHRETLPNKETWFQNIERAKDRFTESTLHKVVLAKESYFYWPNPWETFETLRSNQPDNYHFLFAPDSFSIFMGVSPEQLFSMNGVTLQTEALAGTRAKLPNDTNNKTIQQELTQSDKDQHEHNCVIQYITTQLSSITETKTVSKQEILELPNVQHLRTPMSFKLKNNVSTTDILSRLHPTPAVCGLPKVESLDCIARWEPFIRGWYAGTMGIEHNGKADFTVMIRSALWRTTTDNPHSGYAWSGAGIVMDSEPESEWVEIHNKSKQFLDRE